MLIAAPAPHPARHALQSTMIRPIEVVRLEVCLWHQGGLQWQGSDTSLKRTSRSSSCCDCLAGSNGLSLLGARSRRLGSDPPQRAHGVTSVKITFASPHANATGPPQRRDQFSTRQLPSLELQDATQSSPVGGTLSSGHHAQSFRVALVNLWWLGALARAPVEKDPSS